RFRTFFHSLDAKLPLPTRMLLSVSDFFTNYWYVPLAVAAALVLFAMWLQSPGRGRSARDKMLLNAPALGDLVRHIILERFCRIMSAMMSAGVPLPEALNVTSDATGNTVFRR